MTTTTGPAAATATASLVEVTKHFGGRTVLRGVTWELEPATRYVVRGPSGCGKSTLLNLLAGYALPDSGAVRPAHRVGYLLQDEMLFSSLTVRQNLEVRSAALGLDPETAEARWRTGLARTNVLGLVDETVARLSGGERQRVQLAAQLLASVDLLLLDEPTSKLDASNRRDVAAVVASAFDDCTVVVVTHDEETPFATDAVQLHLKDGGLTHA